MTHGVSSNTFAEAALILRELKERVDRQEEQRTGEGPVNIFRGVTDTTLGVDTVNTSTDTSPTFVWDSDHTWDYGEWG